MLYLWGCSSCKSYHRTLADLIDYWSDASIFGAEVMSPFRYAVCLIYRIKGNLYSRKEFNIFILSQRFRCHIEKLCDTRKYVGFNRINSRFIQR